MLLKHRLNNAYNKAEGLVVEVSSTSNQIVVVGICGWDKIKSDAVPLQVSVYRPVLGDIPLPDLLDKVLDLTTPGDSTIQRDRSQREIVASGYIICNVGYISCVVCLTQVFSKIKVGDIVAYQSDTDIPPYISSSWPKPAVAGGGLGYLFMDEGSAQPVLIAGVTQPERRGPCTGDSPIMGLDNTNTGGLFQPFKSRNIKGLAGIDQTFTYTEGLVWNKDLASSSVDLQFGGRVLSLVDGIHFDIMIASTLIEVIGLDQPLVGDMVYISTKEDANFAEGVVVRVWEGPNDTKYEQKTLKKARNGLFFRPTLISVSLDYWKFWYGHIYDKYYYRFRKLEH